MVTPSLRKLDEFKMTGMTQKQQVDFILERLGYEATVDA